VLSCECSGCADKATSCDTSGLCIDSDCTGKTCDMGQFCADTGTCTDACAGAKCPAGSECKLGDCVPVPVTPDKDAGVILPPGDGDGGDGDDLPPPKADAGSKGDDAGSMTGDGDGTASVNVKKSGCGCRVPGSRDTTGQRGGALFGLLVLGSLLIRRRRR
jgi:MYXO-CTERM domain-containing protein